MNRHKIHMNEDIGFSIILSKHWRRGLRRFFSKSSDLFYSPNLELTLRIYALGAVNDEMKDKKNREARDVKFLQGWKMAGLAYDIEAVYQIIQGGDDTICFRYSDNMRFGKTVSTIRNEQEYWIHLAGKKPKYESTADLVLSRLRFH